MNTPSNEFDGYYYDKSIILICISSVILILITASFGFLDTWMMPDSITKILMIRYLLIVPSHILVLMCSFNKKFQAIYQQLLLGVILVNGFGTVWMIISSNRQELGFYFYYNSIFVVLIASSAFYRLKFKSFLTAGFMILFAYTSAYILIKPGLAVEENIVALASSLYFIITIFIISAVSNYFFEYYLKKDFNNAITINEAHIRLKELDRAKSRFFANISHEFRTPLTLILSPIEAIMQGDCGLTDSNRNQVFRSIRSNALKLLKLINSILDISKMESSRMTVNKRMVDVSGLLSLYTANLISAVQNKKINITLSDKSGGISAMLDTDLFEKAFFNILSNAVKFTPEGGSVSVILEKEEGPIRDNEGILGGFSVTVRDTGPGISEDKLDSIFERFLQLDSPAGVEGTGIGLALAKEMVNLMGGVIGVQSSPGKGSEFKITLPFGKQEDFQGECSGIPGAVKPYLLSDITEDEADIPENVEESASGEKPFEKILIVEDNKEMQYFLNDILSKTYVLSFAQDGIEGLEKACREIPDLILSDLMMPQMDGLEMLRELKSKPDLMHIPVILLTAKSDAAHCIEGFEKGAIDYISKPFNTRELAARIKAQLELKKLRDAILKSEYRFREMADLLSVGIIETDSSGIIDYINPAAIGLLGESKETFPSKNLNILDLLCHNDREPFRTKILHNKGSFSGEMLEYSLKSGESEFFPVLIRANAVSRENGDKLICLTIFDISPGYDLVKLPDEKFYQDYGITDLEKVVLIDILKGFKNREIADKHFVSEITIKRRITNLFRKTDTCSREGLIRLVRKNT